MAKNKQKNKKTAQRDMAKKKSKRKELIIVSIAAGLLLMLLISLVAVRLVNSSGVNISEIYTDGYQTVTLYKNGSFTAELSHGMFHSGKYEKTAQDGSASITYTFNGITAIGVIENNQLHFPAEWLDGHVHNTVLQKSK